MDLLHAELLNIPTCKITYQGRHNALNFPITGFATDSRTVKSDETFIALPGEKFDGHRFISDVRETGVKNFIVSESWYNSTDPSHLDGNFFIVADTLFAMQEISRYYRLKFDIPLIALTGSNGKTTTKEMIASV
ncbi:MAG TPA: Mur ligase domain-containing protein, partial [bacterium]